MNRGEFSKKWYDEARNTLADAKYNFEANRYHNAIIFCEQALELLVKGIVILKTGEIPRKTHRIIDFIPKLNDIFQ